MTPGLPPLRLIGQVGGRLLMLEGEAGLYLVDQHRAHERILYERMRAGQSDRGCRPEPVVLPEPLLIEVTFPRPRRWNGDSATGALGFALEEFGGRAFLLRTAPGLARRPAGEHASSSGRSCRPERPGRGAGGGRRRGRASR